MLNKLSPLSNSTSALLEFRMPESASQRGGVCSWGCVCSGGVSALGEWLLPGGLLLGGVLSWGCLLRGVVSQHALRQPPPPVNRITDTSKNNLGHNFVAAGNNNGCYITVTVNGTVNKYNQKSIYTLICLMS